VIGWVCQRRNSERPRRGQLENLAAAGALGLAADETALFQAAKSGVDGARDCR